MRACPWIARDVRFRCRIFRFGSETNGNVIVKIFVLGNVRKAGVREVADRLLPFLRQHSEVLLCDLCQELDLAKERADIALVLGGDGAILRAARQMGYRQTPVLGVNLGKLGFLADLSPEELRACFPRVVQGEYRVTSHLMFECIIEETAKDGTTPVRNQTILGLNEVAVHAGSPFHMLELDLIVDGETVSSYGGDGLIVGTPVGSTAHSLSAGGPILGQELSAFVLTPICPHALSSRPVVDSADKVYTIALRRCSSDTSVVIDGQERIMVSPAHRISVRQAPVRFGLVKVPGRSYYQTLREKLHWGTHPHYRTEL
jgi:NAD+ kinase